MSSLIQNSQQDDSYLIQLRLFCPFCKKPGQYKKIYSNLLKLRRHFGNDHSFDSECQQVVSNLHNLIRLGVLH